MVELLLMQKEGEGLVTNFWNKYKFEWPLNYSITITLPEGDVLFVVMPAALALYREKFFEIDKVRKQHLG